MTAAAEVDVEERPGGLAGPAGHLHRLAIRPSGMDRAWARLVVVHGYGDHSERYREFMSWMARRGVACEAADLRGHGRSEGKRGFVPAWEAFLDDLGAFLEAVRAEAAAHPLPLFILGHSHGGLLVAAAGERGLLEGVEGCILSAPFLRSAMRVPRSKILLGRLANLFAPAMAIPNGIRSEMMSSDPDKVREGHEDPLLFRIATPRWYFGVLRAQIEVMRDAPKFRQPLLILAGDADPVADHRATYEFIHEAESDDKSLRILPDQLHEILRESDRAETFAYILEWLHDRLHPDTEDDPEPGNPARPPT